MWNPHCGYYALMFDTVDLSFNSFEGSSNFSTSDRCLQKLVKYIFLWKLKINREFCAYCKVWTEYHLWRPNLTKSHGLNIYQNGLRGINLGCWLLQEVKPAFVSGGWQAGRRQARVGYTSPTRPTTWHQYDPENSTLSSEQQHQWCFWSYIFCGLWHIFKWWDDEHVMSHFIHFIYLWPNCV